jgi:membrane associated rhomboid family serine protease
MREVAVPLDGGRLPLDVCRSCQFLWFDPKELDRLPKKPPAKSDKVELPPEAREKIALLEVQREAERAAQESHSEYGPDETWQWIPGLLGLPIECSGNPVGLIPWATWAVAVLLIGMFALTAANLEQVINAYGLVPAEWWRLGGLTLVTCFFLHGGLWHLIGNTYFLLIFGDNVEEYLGRLKYVLLVLLATLAGGAAHVAAAPGSELPCVGASGGISGVIVFYALKFPEARLGILFRYWFCFRWLHMPAYVALILWLLMQFVLAGLQLSELTNVSALAHLGGASVGIVAWLLDRKK